MTRLSISLLMGLVALGAGSPAAAGEAKDVSGPYIGIDVGGQELSDHYFGEFVTGGAPWDVGTHFATGLVVGVHGGYDRQVGKLLIGGEADFEVPNQTVAYGEDSWTYSSKITAQGSVRLRLGLVAGRVQVYATGGLAVAEIKNTYLDPVYSVDNRLARTNAGYIVGGGLGYGVGDRITVRLEYRYTDFGVLSTDVNTGWDTIDRNRDKSQSVRAGVSLRL